MDIDIYIGTRIREVRKAMGLSIKGLAERVGLSYLTMQKIETDKISPSLVVLARIAEGLDSPITAFLESRKKPMVLIKKADLKTIETKAIAMKMLVPKGAIDDNVTVWLGNSKKNATVNLHRNEGFEFVYVIKGRTVFKYGSERYEMDEGDVAYYDASELHGHTAVEPHEFLGIHFAKGKGTETADKE